MIYLNFQTLDSIHIILSKDKVYSEDLNFPESTLRNNPSSIETLVCEDNLCLSDPVFHHDRLMVFALFLLQ